MFIFSINKAGEFVISLAKKSRKYPGGEGSTLKLDTTQDHGTK
jgi:hypothetical protein